MSSSRRRPELRLSISQGRDGSQYHRGGTPEKSPSSGKYFLLTSPFIEQIIFAPGVVATARVLCRGLLQDQKATNPRHGKHAVATNSPEGRQARTTEDAFILCYPGGMVPIEEFAAGLASIPEKQFTHQAVLDYMRANRVDVLSLAPYLYFSGEHYTRNLIHRTPLFELIAICWETGQRSAIHNHRDQCCWMAMAYGKVQVQNFRLVRKDAATGFCGLEHSTHF